MKTIFPSFLILFMLLTGSSFADTNPPKDLVELSRTFMQENNIPGMAVELYQDGNPISWQLGYANLEKKLPITRSSIFEIGSISKVMTALLFAQEVDFAKMGFNSPITKYLTDYPENLNSVTLKKLATHTSGLPFILPETVHTSADVINYLKTWELNSTEWQYSNVGIGLLGEALEKSSHMNFDELYRRHILNPLKMQPIGLSIPKKYNRYIVQGYDENTKPFHRQSLDLFPTAWAIKTTPKDIQHFLSAAIGLPGTPQRILYPMRITQSLYVRLETQGQGLGWQIHELNKNTIEDLLEINDPLNLSLQAITDRLKYGKYDGDNLIDKTGATNGFRAYIAVIPNKKSGIVILTNKYIPDSKIKYFGRYILFKASGMLNEDEKV